MLPALATVSELANCRRSSCGARRQALAAEQLLVAGAVLLDVGVGLRAVEQELRLEDRHPLADLGADGGGGRELGVQRVDGLDGGAARVAAGLTAQPLGAAVVAVDQQPAVRLRRAVDVLAVALRTSDQSHGVPVRSVGPCTSTGRPAVPRFREDIGKDGEPWGARRRRSAGSSFPRRRPGLSARLRREIGHGATGPSRPGCR